MDARGLVLVDIQQGFDDPFWGARNNPDAENQARRLLAAWREAGEPVFHVCHLSVQPGSPMHPARGMTGFQPVVAPLAGEPVYEKSVNSGFIGTTLEADLRAAGVGHIVICGLTTPHCVSTTARMAANLGFDVTLAHDACAAVAQNADARWRGGSVGDPQAIHEAALDHLNGEFARVASVAEILAR